MAGIEEAVDKISNLVAALPGVVLVGQSEQEGRSCILIVLETDDDLAKVRQQVSPSVEGFPVVFQVGDAVYAQPES